MPSREKGETLKRWRFVFRRNYRKSRCQASSCSFKFCCHSDQKPMAIPAPGTCTAFTPMPGQVKQTKAKGKAKTRTQQGKQTASTNKGKCNAIFTASQHQQPIPITLSFGANDSDPCIAQCSAMQWPQPHSISNSYQSLSHWSK